MQEFLIKLSKDHILPFFVQLDIVEKFCPLKNICSTCVIHVDNPNTEIEVIDVIDLNFDDINNLIDIDGTATQYMMAAAWRVSQQKGLSINW